MSARAVAVLVPLLVAALSAAACDGRSNVEGQGPAVTGVASPGTVSPPDNGRVDNPASTGGVGPRPARIDPVDCPLELAAPSLSCALAEVPIDRNDPSSGTTWISLAVFEGADPDSVAPLAVLQGGPGGASTDLVFLYPRQPYPQILIDQRGTGFGSTDLDCPEFEEVLPEVLAATSADAVALEQAASQACGNRLEGDSVATHTNSRAHAADAAEVMAGLGYDRWFAYGVSYGTTIALELARDRPQGLVGVVLDGVYPPDLDIDTALATSAASSLERLDAACAADRSCRAILADVDETLTDLMARLDDQPLVVSVDAAPVGLGSDVDVLIDGYTVAHLVFLLSYDSFTIGMIPGVLEGLDRGDNVAPWLGAALVNLSVFNTRSNAEGTYLAVQCAERLPLASGVPGGIGDYEAAIAGSGLAGLCDDWDWIPPTEAAGPVVSDLPVLLLSGRFDPITPSLYAERAAATLANSTVVVRDGKGHGVWGHDSCIGGIVDDFLTDPSAEIDVSCALEPVPMNWAERGSFD